MMAYVGIAVVSLLALYGVAQAIGQAAEWWWRPPNGMRSVVVLPLSGHCEDVEYRVRSMERQFRWVQMRTDARLVVIDAGLDEESRRLAAEVCARMPGVSFSEKGEWNLQ